MSLRIRLVTAIAVVVVPALVATHTVRAADGLQLPALSGRPAVARVVYVDRPTDVQFKPPADPKAPPADAEMIDRPGTRIPNPESPSTSLGASRIPFVIRVETGTINRGIYEIAMLNDGWNR